MQSKYMAVVAKHARTLLLRDLFQETVEDARGVEALVSSDRRRGLPLTGRVRAHGQFGDHGDRSHHAVFQASSARSSGVISQGSG